MSVIYELFKEMNFPPGNDTDTLAMSWLEKHNRRFFGFYDGRSLQKEEIEINIESKIICYKKDDNFTGKHLCDVFVASDNNLLMHVSKNSVVGFRKWSHFSGLERSKLLYKVAQSLEKYQQLFSIIESISSGKHLHNVKNKDIPNLIQSFYYYAGCALELEEKSERKSWYSFGPICVIAEEYNNPSISLSLRVASLLAAGNSILLLADVKSFLSAFLLADICAKSGIPSGVLNVLPIDQEQFKIERNSIFIKLIFTGSYEKAALYFKLSGEGHTPCEVLVPRRPTIIVYETADLYAAADGVFEAFCFHDTRSKSGGCKVMIQESIATKFLKILEDGFSKILIGKNLSKTDLSCIVTKNQIKDLSEYIKEAETQSAKICLRSDIKNCDYCYMGPTFISNVQPNFKLVHEELGGPVIVAVVFRTVKESISMFNCDNKGSPVSIWTEKNAVAMEVAQKLKSGVVQLNSQNLLDTSVPFSGVYLSGNSVEGGKDAFFNNLSPYEYFIIEDGNISSADEIKYETWLSSVNIIYKPSSNLHLEISENIKEYKLYIGGVQKKSDNGTVQIVEHVLIPNGSEADVTSAVSSAVASQPKWEAVSKYQRRQILLSVFKHLESKKQEFIRECNIDADEVKNSVDILYFWAFNSDKYGGQTEEIQKNVKVVLDRNPLGVIGIQCSTEKPLLSFIALIAPAIMFGNSVVTLASEKYPIPVLKMGQIFSLLGIPAGVINIISGSSHRLIPCLCKNLDVNAVWFTDVPYKVVYANCHIMQKVFYCESIWEGFNEAKKLKCVMASTYTKAIFLPMGEIFAN